MADDGRKSNCATGCILVKSVHEASHTVAADSVDFDRPELNGHALDFMNERFARD
jgi:hypothetical protein